MSDHNEGSNRHAIPALGGDVMRFREVAAEHPLEQTDGVVGVVAIVLVHVAGRARALVALGAPSIRAIVAA